MLHKNVGVQNLENGGWYLAALAPIYAHERVWQENLEQAAAGQPDNPSNSIGHSCEPNLWWQGENTLVASRNIEPGEAITFDYATKDVDGLICLPMNCACGAQSCRHTIQPDDLLRYPQLREKYQGNLPPSVNEWLKAKLCSDSICAT